MHHQSQCGQWHMKGHQPCSEEDALTSQVTACFHPRPPPRRALSGGRHPRQSWHSLSPAFPLIRFRLKSQFNAAQNRIGILFPLSCLLLLAFRSAQPARLVVTWASKLIKTHSAQFKLRQTSPGARRSPLVTSGPQLPIPASQPARPTWVRCRASFTASRPSRCPRP